MHTSCNINPKYIISTRAGNWVVKESICTHWYRKIIVYVLCICTHPVLLVAFITATWAGNWVVKKLLDTFSAKWPSGGGERPWNCCGSLPNTLLLFPPHQKIIIYMVFQSARVNLAVFSVNHLGSSFSFNLILSNDYYIKTGRHNLNASSCIYHVYIMYVALCYMINVTH
jgi:hypothetical protein